MNTASRYQSLLDRVWLISFVRQSETKSRTLKEFKGWAPPLSPSALYRHLAFIVERQYLRKEKKRGSYSIYKFNRRFERRFNRIGTMLDKWLGFSTLHKTTKAWQDLQTIEGVTPRKFQSTLRGLVGKDVISRLVGNKEAIEQFETEFRRIGVEL
jgi:hypothetical protein